jgi:hypothetical protein
MVSETEGAVLEGGRLWGGLGQFTGKGRREGWGWAEGASAPEHTLIHRAATPSAAAASSMEGGGESGD